MTLQDPEQGYITTVHAAPVPAKSRIRVRTDTEVFSDDPPAPCEEPDDQRGACDPSEHEQAKHDEIGHGNPIQFPQLG